MKITVMYFASLREAIGSAAQELELPASVATVQALRDHLLAGGVAALGETPNLRVAVNHAMASPETAIDDGDEVAFFPPVTGG